VIVDFMELQAAKRLNLYVEAERERLAAQLPRRPSRARHALALTCRRLANWLDTSNRYVRPSASGPPHWAA
jgi:hypothetical protein